MPGYPQAFPVEPILVETCVGAHRRLPELHQIQTEPGKSKQLAEGKAEAVTRKSDSKCLEGATQ